MTPEAATDPQGSVAVLLERIRSLEAERDIRAVMHRYGEALDYGLVDEFVGLFTTTGTWRIRRGGQLEKSFSGSDELRRFAAGHTHAPEAIHKHVVSNITVTVEDDLASARSYFVRLDAAARDGEASFVLEMGRYEDRFERDPSGVWRFSDRLAIGEDHAESPILRPLR